MSNYIFVGAFTGVSPKTGKQFTRVTLIEKGGKFFKPVDVFVKDGNKLENQDGLKFGDVVCAALSAPTTIGGKSELVGLKVVRSSPYSDKDFTE